MSIKLCIPALEAKTTDAEGDDPLLKKAKQYLEELSKVKVSNNCQKFAVALECKFRGMNKTPTPTGSPWDRVFDVPKGKSYPIQNWCLFKSARFTPIKGDAIESITKTMNGWGKGSRAIIAVTWKGGRGHVFNLINTSSGVYLMDSIANRLKPIEKSGYLKNNVDSKASLGLIRSDSGSLDKDMLAATFDEEGKLRFILERVDGVRIRAMSTNSISKYVRMFAHKSGQKFYVYQYNEESEEYDKIGTIKIIEVVQEYGDDKFWAWEWV